MRIMVCSVGVALLSPITNGCFLLAGWLSTMKHHDWLDQNGGSG